MVDLKNELVAKISSKGLVNIPADFRRKLKIQQGDYVSLELKNNTILMTPVNVKVSVTKRKV